MAEQQYIDIFTQYKDVINSKSAEGINALREKAFEVFKKNGLPTSKLEDYKYIAVDKLFASDYGLNINRLPLKGNPYFAFRCEVENLSKNLFYMLNDMCNEAHIPDGDYPDGVFVGSLKTFAEINPNVFAQYYGKIANVESNPQDIVAFNTMFAQDGFVVYVPDNIIVETPIQLINILKSDLDYLVNRRILVIAGENSQVKLLACDHTVDNSRFLVTQVTEIYAGKNAVVDFYELEEDSTKVSRVSSLYAEQEEASNVLVNNITLQCGITRNNYRVKLNGERAESYICGMVIADKEQYVDNFISMDHSVPNCHSTQLFKYILQDKAKGAFCGRIVVEKDAQKTLAYQSNNNLCISPDARMYSKPQLEIYADDVKCSHGLTTGQLDEDAMFYLRARGISKQDARLMLMQAFMADVLSHVRIDSLRHRLSELVEKRLRGDSSARCGNCAVCK